MPIFTETQRFRQWWLWLIVAASFIIALCVLLADGFQPFDLVPLSIPLSLVILMYVIRLDTHIDQAGIKYCFFPWPGRRTIPWTEIQKIDVKISPFTGYGIRWDFNAWYYVIDGCWGLHIAQINGKRLVIGTQQPDELREFLRSFHP